MQPVSYSIVRNCALAFALAGILAVARVSQGDPIPGVSVSGYSSQFVGHYTHPAPQFLDGTVNRPASATVDGINKTINTPANELNSPPFWLNEGVGYKRDDNTLTNDTAPFIKYNLGGQYPLSSVVVYNYNHADIVIPPPGVHYIGHGAKLVDITVFKGGLATDLGGFTFNEAPGTDPFTPQTITLPTQPVADSVLFTIKSNWLGDTYGPGGSIVEPDGGSVGLNEVQFVAVPEPTAGALLIGTALRLLKRRHEARQAD